MKALSVVSEAYPLVKTGGLADVAGALPGALARHGIEVRTLLPGYPAALARLVDETTAHRFENLAGGPARLLAARVESLDVFVIDAPHLYAREGSPYGFNDDAQRFAALARVGAELAWGLLPAFIPDVVHAHDWQAGLVPAYLRYGGRAAPPTVMTIHNLAFQGNFPPALLEEIGLPAVAYQMEGVEFHGAIGFLKAGIRLADRVTTVSPTYAAEIRTSELGMGMDGLLRARGAALVGILNGIDVDVWNPATDAYIDKRYDATAIAPRARNKRLLRERLGLRADPSAPLFALVSRFSWQKGIDLALAALPTALDLGGQLAILGAGDDAYVAAVRAAASAYPGRVGVVVGYDEGLAHLMQAGSDAMLVPSRFEPCGLTQLCALRYGSVPIVARTGGLADTVIDASPMALAAGVATGVQFAPVTADLLEAAISRAVSLYRAPDTWRRIQENGMRTDVSWNGPAREFAALYREISQ